MLALGWDHADPFEQRNQRCKDGGKDRFEFKPNRWFDGIDAGGELKQVSPYKFSIFQAGLRVCLWKKMAFIQMKYVVSTILRRFQLTPRPVPDTLHL